MRTLIIVLAIVSTSIVGCTKSEEKSETAQHVENRTLTVQLAERAQESAGKAPKETRQIMMKAIKDLKESQVMEKALKKGDKIPNFTLPDVLKGDVSSEVLLKQGPLLITFYRGGWCPYCNLQLRDLQKHLPEIKNTGAELVAISPQTPDASTETVKKQRLEYYVLSDVDGKVGDQFGLMFKLNDDLKKVYQKFGIDLQKANGNSQWELPVSATYIVNTDGEIVYAFVDADYKKRAETLELIKILQDMKKQGS